MIAAINRDHIDTDHIVGMPKIYSICILIQVAIVAATVGLLMPYTGPETTVPGVLRLLIFVTTMYTSMTSIYYFLSVYLFPPAYNCWAWLFISIVQLLQWVTVWIDIVLWAGRLSVGNKPKYLAVSEESYNDWVRRVAVRWYIAAAITGVCAIIIIVNLIVYGTGLNRHRVSGAPYLFHGKWCSNRTEQVQVHEMKAQANTKEREGVVGEISRNEGTMTIIVKGGGEPL